jgi:parallel beta-helix repeat protein
MNRRNFFSLLGLGWLASISPVVIASTITRSKSKFKSKQIIFYVSPNGNDRNSGIKPNPQGKNGAFATISKAQQAIRQLKQKQGGTLKQPVIISLRGGTYFLKQPLSFTELDAGTNSFPIAYKAYQQEKPVISGGRIIKGWKISKLNAKTVWTTNIPEVKTGKWEFHQLWVNNERRQRCRYPKQGYLKVDKAPDAIESDWRLGQNRFQFFPGDLKAWQEIDRGEAIVLTRWVESRLPIAGIDEANRIISFKNRSTYSIAPGNSSSSAAGLYYLENVRAFLNNPGEWFLDNKTGQLYYLPLPGEEIDRTQIIAPFLSELVNFNSDWQKGKFVENLSFENLIFSHTEWYFEKNFKPVGIPNDTRGFAQAAYQIPGAIRVTGTRQCTWKQCTIAAIGNYGIDFENASFNNQILQCQFFDLGAGAVKVYNFGNIKIEDCHIYNGGRLFPSAVAIWIGDAANNLVSRNHIHDFYYSAISVGWSWGYNDNAARGNIIESNHIHHIGKLANSEFTILNDKGGIYTLGVQPETTIHSNLIHDIYSFNYGAWGVYLDEGSSQIKVENNIIYNTRDGGFHLHFGRDNIVRNNVFALGEFTQLCRSGKEGSDFTSLIVENNIIYWRKGKLLGGKWEDLRYVFDRNLYWQASDREINFDRFSWRQWQQQGMDRNSQIADPLFVAPQKGNFRLKPNSPALAMGFKPIKRG